MRYLPKDTFIELEMDIHPTADKEILAYIWDETISSPPLSCDVYESQYKFILKLADRFNGTIKWVYRRRYVVFVTDNNVCYYMYGIYTNYTSVGELRDMDELTPDALAWVTSDKYDTDVMFSGECDGLAAWLIHNNGTLSIVGRGFLPQSYGMFSMCCDPTAPKYAGCKPWQQFWYSILNVQISKRVDMTPNTRHTLSPIHCKIYEAAIKVIRYLYLYWEPRVTFPTESEVSISMLRYESNGLTGINAGPSIETDYFFEDCSILCGGHQSPQTQITKAIQTTLIECGFFYNKYINIPLNDCAKGLICDEFRSCIHGYDINHHYPTVIRFIYNMLNYTCKDFIGEIPEYEIAGITAHLKQWKR